MNSTVTINLTGRPPVRINEANWPIVASGEANNSRNGIVYGTYDTRWQGEHGHHAGELLQPGDDVPNAVQRIAGDLWGDGLAQAVLDDLAPEELE